MFPKPNYNLDIKNPQEQIEMELVEGKQPADWDNKPQSLANEPKLVEGKQPADWDNKPQSLASEPELVEGKQPADWDNKPQSLASEPELIKENVQLIEKMIPQK